MDITKALPLTTEADIAEAEAEIAKMQEATEKLEQVCAEVQERQAQEKQAG